MYVAFPLYALSEPSAKGKAKSANTLPFCAPALLRSGNSNEGMHPCLLLFTTEERGREYCHANQIAVGRTNDPHPIPDPKALVAILELVKGFKVSHFAIDPPTDAGVQVNDFPIDVAIPGLRGD